MGWCTGRESDGCAGAFDGCSGSVAGRLRLRRRRTSALGVLHAGAESARHTRTTAMGETYVLLDDLVILL